MSLGNPINLSMNFLSITRQNDSFFHISTAREWIEIGKADYLNSPLLYAAIEYRLACERILFELYLFLNNPYEFDREKEKSNLKSTSALITAIHRVFDNKGFLKLAQIFNQYYASLLTNDAVKVAFIDTGKLHGFWDHLSGLCHMQIEPNETWESKKWVKNHYDKLDEIDDYLATIFNEDTTIGWVQLSSIPEQILEVREDFMDLKITPISMKRRVKFVFDTLEGMDEFKKTIAKLT